VVSESYDEVVFTDPSETFFGQLQRLTVNPPPPIEHSQREHFGSFSDHDICAALVEAQKFLTAELDGVKRRLISMDAETAQVDAALREQARQSKVAATAAAAASQQKRSPGAAGSAKSPAAGASSSSTARASSVAATAAGKSQPASKKLKAG
jgi:hypothetical protein